jgi:hypothetical protein
MAFPVSFAVGAALGATAAYLYKDAPARESLIEKSKQLKDKAVEKINAVREKRAAERMEREQQQPATATAA